MASAPSFWEELRVERATLGTDGDFVDALATCVMEALPDLSRPSMQQINEGNPVSLNMVNEYTRLYTKDQLQLVPQVRGDARRSAPHAARCDARRHGRDAVVATNTAQT